MRHLFILVENTNSSAVYIFYLGTGREKALTACSHICFQSQQDSNVDYLLGDTLLLPPPPPFPTHLSDSRVLKENKQSAQT